MRRVGSFFTLQLLALQAALFALAGPAVAQGGGAAGGNALQGGVTARDQFNQGERQEMRLHLGQPASGFIDNGLSLQGEAHTERVPPEVYKAWLNDNHQKFSLNAQTMANGLVVDVAGRWDHADKTLDKFGINYTHIKTGDITPEILAGAKVVIINCAGEVRRDRLQFIRDFVQRGGYLLTTDWALNNMVEQTFPGYINWNKGQNGRSIYAANFVSPDQVLAKGCVRSAPWKLDAGAHMIGVLRHDQVRVLIASPDLAAEDPDRTGVLACLFPFGKGYVLHMLGHFDNNAPIVFGNLLPDPAPKIGISLRQALAANFVVAGLTGEPIVTSGGVPQAGRGQPFGGQPNGRLPYGGQATEGQTIRDQFPPREETRPQGYPTQQTAPGFPVQQPPATSAPFQPQPATQGPSHTSPGQMPPVAPDRLHRQGQ